jgi:ferrous iron transport protein A
MSRNGLPKKEHVMVLSELHRDDQAEILRLDADKALRDRFASFGIMPGETVTVQECSLAKQTIEVQVGATTIALRKDEADKIEVEFLENPSKP